MVNKWYQNIVTSLTALGEVSEDDGVLRGRKGKDHSHGGCGKPWACSWKWTQYLKSRTNSSFENQWDMIYIKIKAINTWEKYLGKILKGENAYPFLRKIKCHILKEGESRDMIEGKRDIMNIYYHELPATYPKIFHFHRPLLLPFIETCFLQKQRSWEWAHHDLLPAGPSAMGTQAKP